MFNIFKYATNTSLLTRVFMYDIIRANGGFMNKQINLQDAIQISELLAYCRVVRKEGDNILRIYEQQVLDYAIEMSVKNNTSILEEVRKFENNKLFDRKWC